MQKTLECFSHAAENEEDVKIVWKNIGKIWVKFTHQHNLGPEFNTLIKDIVDKANYVLKTKITEYNRAWQKCVSLDNIWAQYHGILMYMFATSNYYSLQWYIPPCGHMNIVVKKTLHFSINGVNWKTTSCNKEQNCTRKTLKSFLCFYFKKFLLQLHLLYTSL
jgi:hypothetical protein